MKLLGNLSNYPKKSLKGDKMVKVMKRNLGYYHTREISIPLFIYSS